MLYARDFDMLIKFSFIIYLFNTSSATSCSRSSKWTMTRNLPWFSQSHSSLGTYNYKTSHYRKLRTAIRWKNLIVNCATNDKVGKIGENCTVLFLIIIIYPTISFCHTSEAKVRHKDALFSSCKFTCTVGLKFRNSNVMIVRKLCEGCSKDFTTS